MLHYLCSMNIPFKDEHAMIERSYNAWNQLKQLDSHISQFQSVWREIQVGYNEELNPIEVIRVNVVKYFHIITKLYNNWKKNIVHVNAFEANSYPNESNKSKSFQTYIPLNS